jgi:hypothetical protein
LYNLSPYLLTLSLHLSFPRIRAAPQDGWHRLPFSRPQQQGPTLPPHLERKTLGGKGGAPALTPIAGRPREKDLTLGSGQSQRSWLAAPLRFTNLMAQLPPGSIAASLCPFSPRLSSSLAFSYLSYGTLLARGVDSCQFLSYFSLKSHDYSLFSLHYNLVLRPPSSPLPFLSSPGPLPSAPIVPYVAHRSSHTTPIRTGRRLSSRAGRCRSNPAPKAPASSDAPEPAECNAGVAVALALCVEPNLGCLQLRLELEARASCRGRGTRPVQAASVTGRWRGKLVKRLWC